MAMIKLNNATGECKRPTVKMVRCDLEYLCFYWIYSKTYQILVDSLKKRETVEENRQNKALILSKTQSEREKGKQQSSNRDAIRVIKAM